MGEAIDTLINEDSSAAGDKISSQLKPDNVQRKLLFSKEVQGPLMEEPVKAPKQKQPVVPAGQIATPVSRKSARIASKGPSAMTMEEHATALLIKKSGFLQQKKMPDPITVGKFREQFATPM